MTFIQRLTPFILPFFLISCGDDDLNTEDIDAPSSYQFDSLTQPGLSSVDYSHATSQLILIKELEALINSDDFKNLAKSGEAAIKTQLSNYYTADPSINTNPILGIESETPLKQTHLSDLNVSSLKSSLAGIHSPLYYRDTSDTRFGNFIGWNLNSVTNEDNLPNAKIQFWFDSISTAIINDDSDVVFTNRVLNSFLLGAVAYYQATGSLLNTGLNAQNSSTERYTDLQHNWDLAFGYFGAQSHYGDNTAQENTTTLSTDLNSDGQINLLKEYNFQYAILTADSDKQSNLATSNYSKNIFSAFLKGRAIIDLYINTNINEDPEFAKLLLSQATIISENWEKALIVQLIKNINLAVYYGGLFSNNDEYRSTYLFYWALAKNTAVTLQYNPNSIISYLELVEIHGIMKYSSPTTNLSNYLPDLHELRERLADIYNLDLQSIEQ